MSELTTNPIDEARQSVIDVFGENEKHFNLNAEPQINEALFDEMNADAPHFDHQTLRINGLSEAADRLAEVKRSPEINPLVFIPLASLRIAYEREHFGLAA